MSAVFARAVVHRGEPAVLLLTLKNPSRDPISLGMKRPAAGNYRLEVQNAKRERVLSRAEEDPRPRAFPGGASVIQIDAGSEFQQDIDISDLYDLRQTGDYLVRATLIPTGSAVSNWARLTLLDPGSGIERKPLGVVDLVVSPALLDIRQRERVRYDLSLRSFSGTPIRVDCAYWREPYREYLVDVTGPDGRPLEPTEAGRLAKSYRLHAAPREWVKLRPGDVWQTRVDVSDRYDFSVPGRYRLSFYRVVLDGAGGELEVRSRPVELIVHDR